jgi:hypothetical protein
MPTLTAIALVLLSAAARVPAHRPARTESALLAPVKAPEAGPGQVSYVTKEQAFIDRGSADGVEAGAQLPVTRNGKAIGTCNVASVTEHGAVCAGRRIDDLEAGDRISVQRKVKAAPQPLAAMPDARELNARLETLQGTPQALVDFDGATGGGSGAATWLQVVLSHTTYADFASPGGAYHLERVDARLNDLKIWRGLRASADLSVLAWTGRNQYFSSPYAAPVQVFVRQLELAWRDGGRFEAALGRIWVRHAPGLTMLDGAQAGIRSSSGDVEGGAFGGLLPNPLTLAPTLTQWTAGAYLSARFYRGEGADAVWVQPEVRLNYAVRDTLGGRFELGAALHAWAGRGFDAHLQAQAAVLGVTAPGLLDFARLDIALRPSESLRLAIGARYRGNTAGELLEVGAPSPGARGIHGDVAAFYDRPSFSLGLGANVARDLESELWQARVGPQLTLPRLFGRAGGLSVGYAEEAGWLPGRSAWLQVSLQPHWRFKALLRPSWFMQTPIGSAWGLAGHELSIAVALEVKFTGFLWVRGQMLWRQAIAPPQQSETDLAPATPLRAGFSGGAQLGVDL